MADSEFLARLAVTEVVTTTVFLSELGEWERYAEAYADEVEFDYRPSVGSTVQRFTREQLVAFSKAMLALFDATQHQVTNTIVELDGDEAVARSQMRAVHRIGDETWTRGGVYIHHLRREAGRWRIYSQTRVALYEEGSAEVGRRVAEHGAKVLASIAPSSHGAPQERPGDPSAA